MLQALCEPDERMGFYVFVILRPALSAGFKLLFIEGGVMSVDPHEPIMIDPEPIQEEGPTFRDRLALAFACMNDLLRDPNLTPDERYAIAAPLLFWIE